MDAGPAESATEETGRWEDYLRSFHRATPRATSLALELFADARARSSYARLAAILDRMPDPTRLSVLDLGCGDGRLVDHVRNVTGPDANVDALDLVPEEVDRARAWGRRATFAVGRAQALPYADARFDAVLSHFAFMLMVPAAPVVAEIERVLRKRGFFATALATFGDGRGDLAALLVPYRDALARAGAGGLRPAFDPRQQSAEGIARLFAEAGSTRVARSEPVPFSANVDADGAWLFLSTLYFFDALDGPGRARLRERVDALARSRGGRLQLLTTIEFVAMVPPPAGPESRPLG